MACAIAAAGRSRRRTPAHPAACSLLLLCAALALGAAGLQRAAAAPSAPPPAPSKGSSSSSSSSSSKPAAPAPAKAAGTAGGASAGGNPLLSSGLFPLWQDVKPHHIQPAVQQLLAEEGASLDLLEADLARAGKDVTFERVFGPYTQIRYRLDAVYGQIDHLAVVVDSPALRKAVDAITPQRVAFELRMGQSKPIYNAVKALADTPSLAARLSAEQRRIVDVTVRDFRTSGVGLEPKARARFNQISDELSKLSTNFTNNVLDSTAAFKLLITDKSRLAGLEPTTLAVAARKAADAGHASASAEAGPWLLTLDYSTYAAVVSFAQDRDLRRKVYTAYRSTASSGSTDNTGIINRMLQLRRELAQLLGFASYAEEAFTGKMATLQTANALLDQLTAAARPIAVTEDGQLKAFARNFSSNASLELLWWDTAYYAERQKEALFKLKQEELRQYLPLESVKQGMFNLAKRLYGISLKPATQPLPVWHPDVEVYQVSDGDDPTPIAYFYADLFARPGTKQGGAWVQPLSDRAHYWREASPAAKAAAQLRAKAGGGGKAGNASSSPLPYSEALAKQQAAWLAAAPMRAPVAVLIANQNPPAGGKPSLMTLDDAETLFHEFGHALQIMLTRAKEGLTAGMRNIEWDAVETPSQMQEKWVYDRDTLDGFARHWKTGARVPQEMFDQIQGMRTFRKGNYFTYQLMLATTDLRLHSTYVPGGKLTPADMQQEQYAAIMPNKPNPTDRQINSFGHIFTGGYSAGYYSYVWADVMSADGFMAFIEAGPSNDAEIRRLGRRFRDTFLSLGGSVAPAEVYKRFRGREARVESLLKYNNLDKKA